MIVLQGIEVSIVVPVYNGERTIDRCIKSLLQLDYPKEKYEIIIVNNNSTDNTVKIVKEYPVKLLHEKKQSSYAARNLGITHAKGDIIAFTDADCMADKDWLKYLIRNFKDAVGSAGGALRAYNPKGVIEHYAYENCLAFPAFFREFHKNYCAFKYPFIATANALYQKEILEEVGLFDDSFTSSGDVDLAWRIILKGYKIVYDPKAIIYHKQRTTLIGLFKQFFKYGEGHAKLFKKHNTIFSKKYQIDIRGYLSILYNLIIRLPWRVLNAYRYSGMERSLYVATPILHVIRNFGLKLGGIYGSIKYRVFFL